MKNYIKITIQSVTAEEWDIVVADLSELKFYAFDEEQEGFNAYIKEEDFDEESLLKCIPAGGLFSKSFIEEENWNQKWEEGFQPVIIHDFVAIRANFHDPVPHVKYELSITPKMSFGTGHHATTFLMVSQMESIDFVNKHVLDFGTGTGVLAILAAKLGAEKVWAIDCDEWSIQNSIENFAANQVDNIHIEKRDSIGEVEPMDIVLANINLNVLTNAVNEIANAIKPGGLLLTSGFLQNDSKTMVDTFESNGFVKVNELGKENWWSLIFKKLPA